MRLPDFSFPGSSLPEILKNEATLNGYVKTVNAENFIKAGVSGEDEGVVTLPGILDSISVGDSLLEDSVETADKSGSVKIISGWADADISITLLLIDIPAYTAEAFTPGITRFDCLKQIAGTFRQKDSGGKPCVYVLQHPHFSAWGVREFLFSKLKSSESRGKRIITCTLEFNEFDSTIGKSQDRLLVSMEAAAAEPVTVENPEIGNDQRAGLGKMEAKYGKQ
jgi:hypothetical protein